MLMTLNEILLMKACNRDRNVKVKIVSVVF